MHRTIYVLVFGFALAVKSYAQIPAGAHSADDHSREQAAQSALAGKLEAAEAALEKGDFPAAVALLKPLAAEPPASPQVLYDLGFAKERTGAIDDAAAAYEAAIAADAKLGEPRVALGLLEARRGHTAEARTQLTAATTLATAAPALRARAYRALARLDEAIDPQAASADLLEAVKLTGETSDDAALTAELAARSGEPASAEAAYRRALAQHPDDAEAAAGLATVLSREGKAAEAQPVLEQALQAHPGDPVLTTRLAAVNAATGHADQAEPLLEGLHTHSPADTSVTRMLAGIYGADGKDSEAARLYAELLQKQPNDPGLLDAYGSVLVRQQKYAEAEAMLSHAVQLRSAFDNDQAWAEAAGHLAFASDKNKHPQVCLQALAARATVLPNSPSSLFLEAIAHDALHQNKEAARAYRAFLAMAGGDYPDESFEARHRLVALEHEK